MNVRPWLITATRSNQLSTVIKNKTTTDFHRTPAGGALEQKQISPPRRALSLSHLPLAGRLSPPPPPPPPRALPSRPPARSSPPAATSPPAFSLPPAAAAGPGLRRSGGRGRSARLGLHRAAAAAAPAEGQSPPTSRALPAPPSHPPRDPPLACCVWYSGACLLVAACSARG